MYLLGSARGPPVFSACAGQASLTESAAGIVLAGATFVAALLVQAQGLPYLQAAGRRGLVSMGKGSVFLPTARGSPVALRFQAVGTGLVLISEASL